MRARRNGWPSTACSRHRRCMRLPPGQRERAYELAEQQPVRLDDDARPARHGARLAGPHSGGGARPPAAAAAGRRVGAGGERASRGGRAAGGAHPRPAGRRRCAALRVRADPRRRGGLRRRPGPLRRAARPVGRGAAPARAAAAAGACQPHAPSARCSRASRRWRACASSRRRAATPAGAVVSRPLGRLHRRPELPVGRARCCSPRSLLRPTLAAAESRPRPAQLVHVHAGGAARRGGVGAQPARPTPRRCWPTGSTCSSAAACPRPCCSASAPWRASRRPRAPSTARWSCSARCTPSAWRARCRACASPA